ncbi:MAG: hypothetical protein IT306_02515 [Chloroflexi bacterium]|nr:hypothetical protein [Chloroflexota bacterium]
MNALGRYSWRLSIIVVLAFAVTGVLYGVSLTPYGSSFASRRPGPPQAVQAQPTASTAGVTAATAGVTAVDASAVPSDTGQAAVAAAPAQGTGQAAAADASTGTTQLQAPQRAAGGGGRGPNLTRGLPEFGLHAGVIAAIVLIVNSIGFGINRWQRRRGMSRAPVFNHAMARR